MGKFLETKCNNYSLPRVRDSTRPKFKLDIFSKRKAYLIIVGDNPFTNLINLAKIFKQHPLTKANNCFPKNSSNASMYYQRRIYNPI